MIKNVKILIAIGFFLIAIVGIMPSIQIAGHPVGIGDLLGDSAINDLRDVLSYLNEFAGAVSDVVGAWVICSILAIVLPLIEGVLALVLRGKWAMLSSALGILTNVAVKICLIIDINQINKHTEGFIEGKLLKLEPGTMGMWMAMHIAVAGILVWQFVLIRQKEDRQAGFNGANEMIDETVVDRGVGMQRSLMGEFVVKNEDVPQRVDAPESIPRKEEEIDKKGVDSEMNKKMVMRDLSPEEEERRDILFQHLGKAYYDEAGDEPLPQLLPIFHEINSLIMEPEPDPVDELEKTRLWEPEPKTTEESKPEPKLEPEPEPEPLDKKESDRPKCCPECGVYLPEGAKFCEECGYRVLDQPKPVEKPKPMFCPKCGNHLKEGIKFCGKCGTKIQ